MYKVIIRNLNHHFGKGTLQKQVLFNINLEIRGGEIIILTGQSGSGKTTLLSLIGALRSVQQGSLRVLDQELLGANEDEMVWVRRQIGYIFQAHNLLQFMTARQNVQMSVELNKNISQHQARAKSEAILKAVGLENRLNYYPHNLSGGQKQRVAIARALVNHPQLVLADEPTAALDSKTGREVVDLMQHLAREQGCTILLVTHDNRILDIADRILEMEDGHLVKETLADRFISTN
jgi:putative ABC transport system ATP-binding protein